ncbi:hypothetical protein ON010_g3621 [Phytophthora cinnamomi]|nr:hypothetical protein ON010_g3621 [Phytophthora cinnamomi]
MSMDARMAGIMSAAVADIVAPEDRAAAFGVLFCQSIRWFLRKCLHRTVLFSGECSAGFSWYFRGTRSVGDLPFARDASNSNSHEQSPMGSREPHQLHDNSLPEPIVHAADVPDRADDLRVERDFPDPVVLLEWLMALVGQGLLLKPMINCVREKGVIVIALVANTLGTCGFAATAYYPHKWLVYVVGISASISDLSFPAISALKSINASEEEQGRLQGAIYGARSLFEALGPVVFAALYAAMTRQSAWSQALPYVVASFIYFVGVGVALSLPVGKTPPPSKIVAVPAPLLSPTFGESPTSMYFETDDDDEYDEDEGTEDGGAFDRTVYSTAKQLDDDHFLAEPLLGSSSAAHVRNEL